MAKLKLVGLEINKGKDKHQQQLHVGNGVERIGTVGAS